MKKVAVVTNNSDSFLFFIKSISHFYGNNFRFIVVDNCEKLSQLLQYGIFDFYTTLNLSASFHEGEKIINRLKSFNIPYKEAFDFTKTPK